MEQIRTMLSAIFGGNTVSTWTDEECVIYAIQQQEASINKQKKYFKEVVTELIKSKRSVFLELDVPLEVKKECCFWCGYSTTILNTNE